MRSTAAVRCEHCPVRRMPLFRSFSSEELALVAGLKVGQRLADPETEVLDPAETGRVILTVFAGWAYRYRDYGSGRRQILEFLLPGDSIGVDSALLGTPSHPVRALTALNVCVLDAALIQRMLDAQPVLARNVMASLAQEQRRADERLWGQRSGAQRCAYLMLDLHDRLQGRDMAGRRLSVPAAASPFGVRARH